MVPLQRPRGAFRQTLQIAVTIAAVCISICVLISFVAPLAAAISPLLGGTHTNTSDALTIGALGRIILFTFEQSLASTLLAVLVGIPAAFLTARRNFWGRKLLLSTASVPLCIPALIVALGYVSTFGMAGYLNKLLMSLFSLKHPPLTFLYSFWGIVIAQGFYNFPLIMATVGDTWSTLPPEQAENARLLGASEVRVFRTITLYQLLPAIVSACIPVFLYCFFSFMIVLLFGATGCTTLEVAVYHSARSTLDFSSASLLAIIETLCALGTVFAYSALEAKSSRSKGISFNAEYQVRTPLSSKELFPAVIFLFIIVLFFATPLAAIAISSFSTRRFGSMTFSLSVWRSLFSLAGFLPAVRTTLVTALAVSVLCTVTAFVYAVFLRTVDPYSQHPLLRTIPLLPMAVSSVVMGLGMTILVRRGTPLTLILAETALSWPFAFRQLYIPLAKIPDNVLSAADLLSPHRLDTLFRVCIPYSYKGIVSSLGFCFALSAGDATLPLILAIPRFDTLALFTYRLAGSHRFSEASAAGLVLGLLCAGIFTLSNKYKENVHGIF